jgi:hypothetical protein
LKAGGVLDEEGTTNEAAHLQFMEKFASTLDDSVVKGMRTPWLLRLMFVLMIDLRHQP